MEEQPKLRRDFTLFLILVLAVAVGNGFSDSVYANYFKEVYQVTATQRALIEFPRELPGLLCAIVIAALSFLGDFRLALIAQVLALIGLLALGLLAPTFGVMCIFLFINSLGMHLFLPLQDSICMALAEPDRIGRRIGQCAGAKTAGGFLAGLIVFFGFRRGFFNFTDMPRKVFLVGSIGFVVAIVFACLLIGKTKHQTLPKADRKFRLFFRKEYKYYYALTILHGVQKQIAFVFGSWVVVDLLLKGADIVSLLLLIGSFLGIFFMQKLGGWIDRLGVKKMLYLDALTFIGVYVLYGFIVWGITQKLLPGSGWPVMVVYLLFISDRLSMQIGVVKSVYLRSIAITPEDITPTLSTGISLDHVVSIIAAQFSGLVWTYLGPHWVFFIAAFFSLGNLFVAWKVKE